MHYQRIKRHGDAETVKVPTSPAWDWLTETAKDLSVQTCIRWPFAVGKDGYGRVHRPGRGSLTTASRAVCELAHGAPPSPRHEAAHLCGKGNEGCVNPAHLAWKTPAENQGDRVRHGTSNRGERQWQARLTADDVRQIRSLHPQVSRRALAIRFGVSYGLIVDILLRRKWAWVE